MPVIPVGFSQIVFFFQLAGDPEPMLVTLGAETSGITPSSGIDMANGFFDAWRDNLTGMHVTTCVLQKVVMYQGAVGGSVPYESNFTPNDGTGGSTALPPNTALLVKKLTGVAGRKNRGRFYVPGTPESIVDNAGNIGSSNEASYNTQLGLFRTQCLAILGVDSLRVLHTDTSDVPTEITQLKVDPRVATQRRRLR